MLFSVTFPDLGFPTVSFTAGADSLVSDVLNAAAEEWDIDPAEVELSLAGKLLCETRRLLLLGVGPNTELEMWKKRFRLFSRRWFIDAEMREKLLSWLNSSKEEYLFLDTPTFLEGGCLSLDSDLLPRVAERISFRNSNSEVTAIADNFLCDCLSVTSIEFSDLTSVTNIGNAFLSDCTSITALNLGLEGVTTVGNWFLQNCSSITSLDLNSLGSVTTIGDAFLESCASITSLNLNNLSSVTTIGDGFLQNCLSITSLDLNGLGVIIVGNEFLENCSSITSLDLNGLGGVTTVGDGFLQSCVSVTSLDLNGLRNITSVGKLFLDRCDGLQSVELPASCSSLLVEKSEVLRRLVQ